VEKNEKQSLTVLDENTWEKEKRESVWRMVPQFWFLVLDGCFN
jgi:hypothetical protein